MLNNPKMRLEEIDSRLKELPKGTLTYKTINGKKQPYIQRTIQGKSQSVYVKLEGREKILLEFQERKSLEEEKKRLLKYYETLKDILKENPYLDAQVGCGYQDFRDFACGQQFYVDKTHFITQWLRSREKDHSDHPAETFWQDHSSQYGREFSGSCMCRASGIF